MKKPTKQQIAVELKRLQQLRPKARGMVKQCKLDLIIGVLSRELSDQELVWAQQLIFAGQRTRNWMKGLEDYPWQGLEA